VIRVRIVADTVDELDRAADAVGLVLDVTKAKTVPRRTVGVSKYLEAELPTRPAQLVRRPGP